MLLQCKKIETAVIVSVKLIRVYLYKYPLIFSLSPFSFAFMEILLVQVIAWNIPNFSDIPTPAIAAMNLFSFSGLSLIIIGAVFALISARAWCKTANEFNTICKEFRLCDITRFPGSGDAKCFNTPDDLGRLLHFMDHSLDTNFGEFIVNMTGVAFFVLSFCILLVTTQGVAVWVLMTVLIIWLGVQNLFMTRTYGGNCLLYPVWPEEYCTRALSSSVQTF